MNYLAVDELPARVRVAVLFDHGLFASLVVLVCLTAIPYGTREPWWKAFFICLILAATIAAVVHALFHRLPRLQGKTVLLPIAAMSAFAFLQTLPIPGNADLGLPQPIWKTVSADPYETRFVSLQLLSLGLTLTLLYRYASTERRIKVLIHVVLGIAVVSAIFGILRQATQHEIGFLLPALRVDAGFAQFTNKNHFGFLMEMAFGLGLGMLAGRGINRKHTLVYIAMLLPIWTAVVLSNSRGALLAIIVEVLVVVLLISTVKFESYHRDWFLVRWTRSIAVRGLLLTVLIVGVVAAAIWIGGDRLLTNFEGVGRELSQDKSIPQHGVTRKEIWRASLRTFAAHPILGVGLGGYWIAITAHHEAPGTMTPQEAHNDYLELLASGGIVGFAIAAWLVIAIIRMARQKLRMLNSESEFDNSAWLGAVVGISGIAFHSFFDFGLHAMANALILTVLIVIVTTPMVHTANGSHTMRLDTKETN